jgi:hypothetical protein
MRILKIDEENLRRVVSTEIHLWDSLVEPTVERFSPDATSRS